jgi:hypothetical protein
MARVFKPSILAVLGLAAALAGCSASSVVDGMPSSLRLPAGAPPPPTTAYEYPAVHDMPPPRAVRTMTEEQQIKLEKELTAVRDQQEARERTGKKAAQPAKKKPATAKNGEAAGAKSNP